MKTKEPKGQIARWIEHLSSFDFEIRHRPDKKHTIADSLSRIPWRRKEPIKRARAVTYSTADDEELMTIQEVEGPGTEDDTRYGLRRKDLYGPARKGKAIG